MTVQFSLDETIDFEIVTSHAFQIVVDEREWLAQQHRAALATRRTEESAGETAHCGDAIKKVRN